MQKQLVQNELAENHLVTEVKYEHMNLCIGEIIPGHRYIILTFHQLHNLATYQVSCVI